MTTRTGIAGAVLTGGLSRRMGRPKALVEVDGVAMAERVALAMEQVGCEPVWFQGSIPELRVSLRRPIVADTRPGEGPLAGVVAALHHAHGDVVVAACDLPDLDAATVAAVLEPTGGVSGGRDDPDVRVAVVDGTFQLLARWRFEALPSIERAFDDGIRSLHEAYATLRVERVDVAAGAMRNVNHPVDLT